MTTAIDYNELAGAYAHHRRVHPEVLRHLLKRLTPEFKVLEVGCGTGNSIVAIHEQLGCPCWGIDPSTQMLAQATSKSTAVQFTSGRAESLPFPDNYFNLVFSVDVIHHVTDRPRFFHEAHRVLQPDGLLNTVTDSEWGIRHREPLAVYFPEIVPVELARYPRVADLKTEMQSAGFGEIEEQTVEFAYDLTDLAAFRAKVFSSLQLIPQETFQRGIARLEHDMLSGPIRCVSRNTLVWGTKS